MQGTIPINGLVTDIDVPADKDGGKYKIHFSRYSEGSKRGVSDEEEFDLIIGSDGANSRVAKVRLFDLTVSDPVPQVPSEEQAHGRAKAG